MRGDSGKTDDDQHLECDESEKHKSSFHGLTIRSTDHSANPGGTRFNDGFGDVIVRIFYGGWRRELGNSDPCLSNLCQGCACCCNRGKTLTLRARWQPRDKAAMLRRGLITADITNCISKKKVWRLNDRSNGELARRRRRRREGKNKRWSTAMGQWHF